MKKHTTKPAKAVYTVYLLHFTSPYKHARHYLGVTSHLDARLAAHHNGRGARLMEVLKEHSIGFVLARVWVGGHDLERRLKDQHSGVRLCPICKGEITLPRPYVPGRRRPMVERPVQFMLR